MDFNNDGRYDHQDHAFYNNEVESSSRESGGKSHYVHHSNSTGSAPSLSTILKWIGYVILFLAIVTLIGR